MIAFHIVGIAIFALLTRLFWKERKVCLERRSNIIKLASKDPKTDKEFKKMIDLVIESEKNVYPLMDITFTLSLIIFITSSIAFVEVLITQ